MYVFGVVRAWKLMRKLGKLRKEEEREGKKRKNGKINRLQMINEDGHRHKDTFQELMGNAVKEVTS